MFHNHQAQVIHGGTGVDRVGIQITTSFKQLSLGISSDLCLKYNCLKTKPWDQKYSALQPSENITL